MYTVFQLFSTGNYDVDYEVFRIAGLLLYMAGIIIFFSAAGCPFPLPFLFILVFTEWFYPFQGELYWGNLNFIQIGLLAIGLRLRAGAETACKNYLFGTLITVLVFLKPNIIFVPLLFSASWFIDRRWRTVLQVGSSAALTAVAAYGGTCLFFRSFACWCDWQAGFQQIARTYPNANFFAFINLGTPFGSFWICGLVLCGAAVALIFLKKKSAFDPDGPAADAKRLSKEHALMGIGLVAYLLSGGLVHAHYFILTIPLVSHLLRPIGPEESAPFIFFKLRHVMAGVAVWLVSMPELTPMVGSGYYTVESYWGAVALYVAALWDLGTSNDEQAKSSN